MENSSSVCSNRRRYLPYLAAAAAAMVAVASVSAIVFAADTGSAVNLEYKYVKGEQFILNGKSTVDVTEVWKGLPEVAGQGKPRRQNFSFVAEQHVDDIDTEGVATLATRIKSMRIESNDLDRRFVTTIDDKGLKVVVDGQTVTDTTWRADKEDGEEANKLVEQLVRDTTIIKIRKNGSVADITSEGPAAAVAGVAARETQSPVISSIPFPDHPVSPGDTWESGRDMVSMLGLPTGSGDFTSRCTFESLDGTAPNRIASIRQNLSIRLTDLAPEKKSETAPADMRIDRLNVDAVVHVKFNVDEGRIVESKIELTEHREMSINTPAEASEPAGTIHLVADTKMSGTVTISPSV